MSALDVALLRALRAGPHHSSGELAELLGASLPEIEARIAGLSGAGFGIEERPGLGCRLVASPDRLIADDLLARLGESALIREILVFEETDSTNDRAAELGRNGAAAGVAVFAERQNAGRGRFGRKWESPSHLGLWFSLLLRPSLPLAQWPRLTTCAAVALAAAIEKTLRVRIEIKWPNDLHINGKKVAGILVEMGADQAQQPFAVLGIGVNVNHAAADFPPELSEKATSLREAGGQVVDRSALAVAMFRELETRLFSLDSTFPEIIAEATRRSALLGRWIQLGAGEARIEGIAEGLDPDGHLLLRDASGTSHCLVAGEVTVIADGV